MNYEWLYPHLADMIIHETKLMPEPEDAWQYIQMKLFEQDYAENVHPTAVLRGTVRNIIRKFIRENGFPPITIDPFSLDKRTDKGF